jgi:hypothetical protein
MKAVKFVRYFIVSSFFLSIITKIHSCPTLNDSSFPNTTLYKLDRKLFTGYDQFIRPVVDNKNIIQVEILFTLLQVLEIVSFELSGTLFVKLP